MTKEKNKPANSQTEINNLSLTGLEDLFKKPSNNLVKAEYNFLRLPYFIPINRTDRQKFIRLIEKVNLSDGNTVEKNWSVNSHPDYNLPSLFEYKVFLALMQLVQEHKLKSGYLPTQIILPDLNKLCELIGVDSQRWNRVRIKTAIETMASNLCISKNTFYDKLNKKYIDSLESFTLIKSCVFKGDKIDGKIVDQGFLIFNDIVHQNLEQNYVKSLDFDFIQSLNTEIAPILYPHLSAIFNNFKPEQKYWEITYKWIAQRLGITIYEELKFGKDQLKDAHNELIKSGYLIKVEWLKNLKIRYYPGLRALVEDKRQKHQFHKLSSNTRNNKHPKQNQSVGQQSSDANTQPNEIEDKIAFLCFLLFGGKNPTKQQLQEVNINSIEELTSIAIAKGFRIDSNVKL